MKKLLVLTLCMNGYLIAQAEPAPQETREPETYIIDIHTITPKNQVSSLRTVLAGSTIGAVSGVTCQALEGIGCPWILSWILCRLGRNTINQAIVDEIHKKEKSINRSILFDSAWVADWIAYLVAKNYKYAVAANAANQAQEDPVNYDYGLPAVVVDHQQVR